MTLISGMSKSRWRSGSPVAHASWISGIPDGEGCQNGVS
jgi:hypothetical protein